MTIITVLGGAPAQLTHQIQYAADLAKRLKTDLTGLFVLPDPSAGLVYMPGGAVYATDSGAVKAIQDGQTKLIEDMKAAFETETAKHGSWLKSKFIYKTGAQSTLFAAAATLADAIVFPKSACETIHALNPGFDHVLMEAQLPLILAGASAQSTGDNCLIAWDGSPLAARAIRLHLPLIKTYDRVMIAQNSDKLRYDWRTSESADPDELTNFLHRQQISVETVEIEGAVSEGLLQTAKDKDCGLTVMGAYGHSRLGEVLFGGTTRALIRSEAAPGLALCH